MTEPRSVTFFDRMCIDGIDGIYVLSAGFHKRMSTFAQQNRAITLGGTFLDPAGNYIKARMRVGIVGAGAAGVSLASMLAWQTPDEIKLEITVFEREDQALSTYQDTARLIDCRLYEWPLTGWDVPNGKAALPVLSWNSGTGKDVTSRLRKQWGAWTDLLGRQESYYNRIDFKPGHPVTAIKKPPDGNQWTISTGSSGESSESFDIVVLATGPTPLANPKIDYGLDLPVEIERWRWDYWSNEEPVDRSLAGNRVLIFGRGDSALTRALEIGFEWRATSDKEWNRFDQEQVRAFIDALQSLLGRTKGDAFCRRVQEIEENLNKSLETGNGASRGAAEGRAWEALQRAGAKEFDDLVDKGHVRQRLYGLDALGCVEISLAYRGTGSFIDGKAFTLHRWLFAQLYRKEWVRLIPNSDVKCLQIINGKWCIKSQEFDEAYFGVPKPNENRQAKDYTPEFWMQKFLDSLRERKLDLSYGGLNVFDSRSVRSAAPAEQRFFSDLFDSATQDDVFQVLKIVCGGQKAEDWLLDLYEDRLLLELKRRDCVVLNDDQLIEGAFFLRWLPQPRARQFLDSKRLIVRRRKLKVTNANWSDVCVSLFSEYNEKAGTYVVSDGMQFAGIDSKSAREEVDGVLKKLNATHPPLTFDRPQDLQEEVERHLKDESHASWITLRARHKEVSAVLDSHSIKTEIYERKLDFLRNTEDLGGFGSVDSNLSELRLILTAKEHPAARKNKYSHFDKLKEQNPKLANGIKHFYDRSVLRAFSQQHGATIFETFHVEQLPPYTNRPRFNSISDTHEYPRPSQDGRMQPVDLGQFTANGLLRMQRRDDLCLPKNLRDQEPAGCAALDVLLGCTSMERRWIEEAQKQGVRTPVVIDEEKLGGKIIGRVEYYYELKTPDRGFES